MPTWPLGPYIPSLVDPRECTETVRGPGLALPALGPTRTGPLRARARASSRRPSHQGPGPGPDNFMSGPQGRPGAGPAGPTHREAARARMQGGAATAASGQQQRGRGSDGSAGAAAGVAGQWRRRRGSKSDGGDAAATAGQWWGHWGDGSGGGVWAAAATAERRLRRRQGRGDSVWMAAAGSG
ncbi:hypothetical protein BGW80DRAFT_1254091 [Lactifluus volemus]|nr:hypothetical protein BGW80DRAFT_1254091 [Lactifluus volemus]